MQCNAMQMQFNLLPSHVVLSRKLLSFVGHLKAVHLRIVCHTSLQAAQHRRAAALGLAVGWHWEIGTYGVRGVC